MAGIGFLLYESIDSTSLLTVDLEYLVCQDEDHAHPARPEEFSNMFKSHHPVIILALSITACGTPSSAPGDSAYGVDTTGFGDTDISSSLEEKEARRATEDLLVPINDYSQATILSEEERCELRHAADSCNGTWTWDASSEACNCISKIPRIDWSKFYPPCSDDSVDNGDPCVDSHGNLSFSTKEVEVIEM